VGHAGGSPAGGRAAPRGRRVGAELGLTLGHEARYYIGRAASGTLHGKAGAICIPHAQNIGGNTSHKCSATPPAPEEIIGAADKVWGEAHNE
jgi:hypothetical protein